MAYTPVFSQGVKFIKIARIDAEGNDNTLSLQELNNIRIKFSDVGVIDYPVTSIAKYDNYFLFGVVPTNITSSTDNEILNYRFSASLFQESNYPKLTEIIVKNGDYGTYVESYDNLSYFNPSSGSYTFLNPPNIPITFLVSSSFTGSLTGNYTGNTTLYLYKTNIYNNTPQSVVTSSTIILDTSDNKRSGSLNISYNSIPAEGDSFYLVLYTENTGSLNIKNFIVTQSVIPQAGVSNLVVLEPFVDEDFINSDYDVLAGNAVEPRINPFYMDVDYSTNALKAVNINQILAGTATRAAVQQSNYTYASQVNGRYAGSKTTSINYNTYTPPTTYTTSSTSAFGYNEYWPGDEAYGKQASVDIYRNYFAKFINITSSTPEIPGGSKIYITELIDINGNRFPLGQDQYTLDVAYNFTAGTNLSIYNFTSVSASLIGTASVIDGGSYFQTILYSTGSTSVNVFPTFATYVQSNGGTGTNIDGTNNYHSVFTASAPNVLSAVNSDTPTVLQNWLYPFLSSSFQNTPLSKVSVIGVYAGIYNSNTNTIINGFSTEPNDIKFSDIITPIQPNDYIRIGTTGSGFNTLLPITASQVFQITNVYIDPSNDGLTTGSLTLNRNININNFPSPLGQAYIIYRRIPSDSYITINKEINSNSTGLIIPVNFNPAYDPIKIARDAGVI